MFEPQRKYKTCVICGSGDLSKEHLFGRGLAKRLWSAYPWTIYKGKEDNPMKSDHSKMIASISPKLLCKACNGAFEPNMKAAYPILIGLIGGEVRSISLVQRRILVRYFQRLGILADVTTSTEQLDPAYRETAHFRQSAQWRCTGPTYTLSARKLFAEGRKGGASPRVWIGHHMGVLGIDMEVSSDGTAILGVGEFLPHGKRFHAVIGELAVTIHMGFVGPIYWPMPPWIRLDGRKGLIAWPPTRSIDYNDYYRLLTRGPEIDLRMRVASLPVARLAHEEDQLRRAGPYAEAARVHRTARAAAVAAFRRR